MSKPSIDIKPDERSQAMQISADGSKVAVYVIKTDEELVMARSAIELLNTFKPSA